MPNADSSSSGASYWQHLEVLRGVIIRCIIAVAAVSVVAFCLKEPLFRLILAPQSPDFCTWRWLTAWGLSDAMPAIPLINTGLAQQFLIHMQMALVVGALLVSPYLVFEAVRFISPALYPNEKRAALPAMLAGFVMFFMGIALAYLVLFPFTYRFLGTYQVAGEVANFITLDSYISALMMMCLMMGVVFQLPVVCKLLAVVGLLTSAPMRRYRKHAIVAILIASAIITPTGDAFTLMLVSIPIWLLYEASILVVKQTERRKAKA